MEPSSESGCKHLMFIYDLNANFTYVNSDFTNFFWRNFYPQVEKVYEDEAISTMQKEGTLPLPEEILEYIPDIKIYSISTVFGTGGVDCGFASDKYLSEYSIAPESKAKQNR